MNQFWKFLRLFTWSWFTFLLALWISWHSLAKVDFLYPIWYDHGGIAEHIDHFAPQNKFRFDYESTDREARLAHFSGIVNGIQNEGQALENLSYQSTKGISPLLHEAEIIHLHDVARLIDRLNKGFGVITLFWLLMTLMIWSRYNKNYPSLKQSLLYIGSGVGLSLFAIWLIGAKSLFYQFHIWVFPPENQWFFYYQESLMSTLMKAPDLFGMIAVSLLMMTLLFFWLIQSFFYKITCNLKRLPP